MSEQVTNTLNKYTTKTQVLEAFEAELDEHYSVTICGIRISAHDALIVADPTAFRQLLLDWIDQEEGEGTIDDYDELPGDDYDPREYHMIRNDRLNELRAAERSTTEWMGQDQYEEVIYAVAPMWQVFPAAEFALTGTAVITALDVSDPRHLTTFYHLDPAADEFSRHLFLQAVSECLTAPVTARPVESHEQVITVQTHRSTWEYMLSNCP